MQFLRMCPNGWLYVFTLTRTQPCSVSASDQREISLSYIKEDFITYIHFVLSDNSAIAQI